MQMKYLYCLDEKTKDELISQGFKLITQNDNYFVFELKSDSTYQNKNCFVSDKLKMTFGRKAVK